MSEDRPGESGSATGRLLTPLFRIAAALADLSIVVMVVIMGVEIALRQGFNASLGISDEVSGYLLVSMTCFGIAIAIRHEALFRFDYIVLSIPDRLRTIYLRVLYLLALATTLVLFQYLIVYVSHSIHRGVVSDGMYAIPLWIPQISMPIGFGFVILAIVEKLIHPISEAE